MNNRAIFLDLVSIGAIKFNEDWRLASITTYNYISNALKKSEHNTDSVGVVSTIPGIDVGDVVRELSEADLNRINSELIVTNSSGEETSRALLQRAYELGGASPQVCFVSEDAWLRSEAHSVGMSVCPHPLLIPSDWQERYRYVRIRLPRGAGEGDLRTVMSRIQFLPLYVSRGATMDVIGITTGAGTAYLANARIEVDLLGPVDAPLLSDLYLLRDDRAKKTGYLSHEGQASRFSGSEDADRLLLATRDGLVVALPGGISVEGYHFEEAYHGHNLKLAADASLIERFDLQPRAASFLRTRMDVTGLDLSKREVEVLASLAAANIETVVKPLAGQSPLLDGGHLRSRHIHSEDNPRAVREIASRLAALDPDIKIRLHAFTHEGKLLHNVEGEVSSKESNEIVLVTAHLDSTAAFDSDFDPEHGKAPGADDDASGVAAALAIASVIRKLRLISPLRRTIRFVLFNAEEHGLVGSKAYAKQQADSLAMIVAVLQMDMVGYNVKPPRTWEVHAGYWPDPEVQRRSLSVAKTVKSLTRSVSPDLEEPQIHSSNEDMLDEAEGRSDHASFHERGYAACVASEDFFPMATPENPNPDSEGNPAYHRGKDTFIDPEYAADIARVIAATAWILARQEAIGLSASHKHNRGKAQKEG
ncbi:M28 family metallopeptidase [Ensifer sp. Root558]|uniref:M28 family metallopeptidase n=1 Tax=Ensifer sp. Root558 TaxID=1736558 RepID=UPI000712CDF2|nr:M28 family metallopeptidase [Ensifer sp. Root558]KQZ57373.1 hypothetical protein ASD63_23515 [Ensifer sp. Root558]